MNNAEDVFEKMAKFTLHDPTHNWKVVQKERAIMLNTCPVCGAMPGYLCITMRGRVGGQPKAVGNNKYTPHKKRLHS